jgi:hypothetical protein
MSRAQGFEREWMRVFEHLADPLDAHTAMQPHALFNSTSVETGSRTIASTLVVDDKWLPSATGLRELLGARISLITGAHTAARFPFVNPLAALTKNSAEERSNHVTGRLADGGYFDNTGATTIVDLLRGLRIGLEAGAQPGWQPKVILIRNGVRRPTCDPGSSDDPTPKCIAAEERPGADDLAKAIPEKPLSLFPDSLGPLLTIFNVSGIRAHGRQAGASLYGQMRLDSTSQPVDSIRVIDQLTDESLVPLGWYLSKSARDTLDRQLESTFKNLEPAID